MVAEGSTHQSRRKFLAIASVAAASGAGAGLWWYRQHGARVAEAVVPPQTRASRNPGMRASKATENAFASAADTTNPDYQAYLRNLHSEFTVTTDGEPSVSIRLKTVTKLRRQMVNGVPHDSFALYFEGPAEQPLAEVIHRFHHERMGDLEFFLSACGKPGKTISYQAIFDRAA